jgi:hypothetical protein
MLLARCIEWSIFLTHGIAYSKTMYRYLCRRAHGVKCRLKHWVLGCTFRSITLATMADEGAKEVGCTNQS